MQRTGILLEILEHVGPHVTKPMMRQPSYYVPYLSGGIAPPQRFQSLFLSIDHAKEQNQMLQFIHFSLLLLLQNTQLVMVVCLPSVVSDH